MQFQTIPSNNHQVGFQRSNTFPQTDELNAFLLAQATQFVNQNTMEAKTVQPPTKLQPYQRQHIHQNLGIQPYFSDQADFTQHVKHNPVMIENTADDAEMDLDLFLNQRAEELVQNALQVHLEAENLQYTVPSAKYNPSIKRHYKTQNHIQMPVRQVQPIQQVQQVRQPIQQVQSFEHLNYIQPVQQIQQVQYYTPQVQMQPQVQVQQMARPQVQIVGYGKPYILETNESIDISFPQIQLDQMVVPAPIIQKQVVVQKEIVNPSPAPQIQQVQVQVPAQVQAQAANTKPESNMQFIQKGPKGEVLYKTTEGGKNFYVKRGLTPEAVNNYNLAHIIGVGPPVEILGEDGVKMEEGVNLRIAVRDKMITIDEVKSQIQGLHKTMFDTGMAHCDVKFENCLYFPKYKKVLLIDNGDLAPYGNRRKIKTPGANSTLLIHGNEERHRVGPATDLRGFMHIMKNTTDEDINAI